MQINKVKKLKLME